MPNKSILVVDDEPDITESLKLGLGAKGFNVSAYNDPIAALESARSNAYDLILTDIRMPKMNGFELYREIRKENKSTPITFFTSFEIFQKEFETVFPDTVGTSFLKKPLSLEKLEKHIEEVTSEQVVERVKTDVATTEKIRI